MNREVEEGKAHLQWLLDKGILSNEDEPHINNIINFIEDSISKQKIRDEIENTNKEIEWQKENGNVATREKLEYKLEILKSLETK